MSCGEVTAFGKVFYSFDVSKIAGLWETIDSRSSFIYYTIILDERFDIIFLHDIFGGDQLRDPNIFIVTFFVEWGDDIKFW